MEGFSLEYQVIVRRPRWEDVASLDAFFIKVIQHTLIINGLADLVDFQIEEREDKNKKIRQDLATGGKDRFFLLGEYQGQIIATIEYGPPSELLLQCTNQELLGVPEIGTVFVCPNHQRRGVASLLLRTLFQELSQAQIDQVCLDSGYPLAQEIWTHIFGEPTYVLKDFWSPGGHHLIWRVGVAEMMKAWKH